MKNKSIVNSYKRNLCLMSCVLCLLALSGCKVGPNYSRPETIAETSDTYTYVGVHEQDANALTNNDNWWKNFGDPVTKELVEEALANNYDLKATAARVIQAQASLAEAKGMQLPDISYNLNRSRSKQSMNLGSAFGGGRFTIMSTTWSQDISATYILDLFGKLKRTEQAAWADVLTIKTNELALTNSIIASVVNARINIAIAQKRLALARENINSQQQTLEIVQRRYDEGLVGPLDIRLARENLASLKSLEPSIELQLITSQNALDVILGRRPGSSENLPETLEELPQLESIPIGLPASLLDRRPDIKAAEFTLIAANERVGVSISQLYPNLAITGSYGFSGDTLEEIFKYDYTEMYSAIMSLAQPIFKGGQIRAQIKAAKARYEELAATYAGTVLNALREVEDALITEQKLREQLEQAQIQLTEANAAEELSRQRYQNGIEGILAVLESERRSRAAQEQLIILKGQIWSSRVNLHLALGGDWNNTQEIYAVEK
ncbi:MAG: efflux transporter outer membrane subunit [Sedimentisphaerales bacterium]|nr:efflux transporter outer membrane subunit [Sedimentisphaerales bacterium]